MQTLDPFTASIAIYSVQPRVAFEDKGAQSRTMDGQSVEFPAVDRCSTDQSSLRHRGGYEE